MEILAWPCISLLFFGAPEGKGGIGLQKHGQWQGLGMGTVLWERVLIARVRDPLVRVGSE